MQDMIEALTGEIIRIEEITDMPVKTVQERTVRKIETIPDKGQVQKDQLSIRSLILQKNS